MGINKCITVTVEVIGFHHWPGATKHREYLGFPHRHKFIITVTCPVSGSDRETEFHDLQDNLNNVLRRFMSGNSTHHNFGTMSCEHICEHILKEMPHIIKAQVSEDGECSAIVERSSMDEEEAPLKPPKPYVVTLCGSTKFREEYEMAAYILEKLGIAVLSVGGFMHAHSLKVKPSLKRAYDKLHTSKIAMSDGILVLNRGGYIGSSTERELSFARHHHKSIYFLEGENKPYAHNVREIHPRAREYASWWSGEKHYPFIIRDSAMEFAKAMEAKLKVNDPKGGWEKRQIYPDLFDRLIDEVRELKEGIILKSPDNIQEEAVDVANFAMMIFDNIQEGRHALEKESANAMDDK